MKRYMLYNGVTLSGYYLASDLESPEVREKILKEIERYCGDADIGKGSEKTWTQWKSDFGDRILAAIKGESNDSK